MGQRIRHSSLHLNEQAHRSLRAKSQCLVTQRCLVQLSFMNHDARDGVRPLTEELASHAMSPIGCVGINLAIQDAVAAANVLAGPLRKGAVSVDHLTELQRRRMFPTRLTQEFQVMMQKQLVARVLATSEGEAPAASAVDTSFEIPESD